MESRTIQELQKQGFVTIDGDRREVVKTFAADHDALKLIVDPMARIFQHVSLARRPPRSI